MASLIPAQEYMLRRSLMLLVGVRASGGNEKDNINFRPEISFGENAESGKLAFVEILAVFNFWASANWLIEMILPWLDVVYESVSVFKHVPPDLQIRGHIDWSATLETWASGTTGYVVRYKEKRENISKTDYIAFVLSEFISHWEILKRRLFQYHIQFKTGEYFENIESDIETHILAIKEILFKKYHIAAERVADNVKQASILYQECISSSSKHFLIEYASKAPCNLPPERGAISDVLYSLADWRTQYLSGSVWLSDNFGCQYEHDSSLQTLYTMWCFTELSLALIRNRATSLIEHNIIIRQDAKHVTAGDRNTFVYFDPETRFFRPAKVMPQLSVSNILLPSIHPDWLILNSIRPSDGIIIGASYDEYTPLKILELLGHSRNYAIRHTMAFSPVQPDLNLGIVTEDGVYITKSNQFGEKLLMLILKPLPEFEQENRQILDAIVSRLLVEDL